MQFNQAIKNTLSWKLHLPISKDELIGEFHNDLYLKHAKEIHTRDKYKCQVCGFKSMFGMELIHLDHNHNNNNSDNLITACDFCHGATHIGYKLKLGSASFAYVPELTQNSVNALTRSSYVSDKLPREKRRTLPTALHACHEVNTFLSERQRSAENIMGSLDQEDFLIGMSVMSQKYRNSVLEKMKAFKLYHRPVTIHGDRKSYSELCSLWADEKISFGRYPIELWHKQLPNLTNHTLDTCL